MALFLVLASFASILVVIPLVRMDPTFKSLRAREDCRMLAQVMKLLPRLRLQERGKAEIWTTRTTLLYTWKETSDVADSIDRWPHFSETIRPWRYYRGITNDLPAGFQKVKKFLKNFHSDNKNEQDLLLRAASIGFDPWGKAYLINAGNMAEKEAIEPGFILLTWAISAGKNGAIETVDYVSLDLCRKDSSQISSAPRGDDIGCMIIPRVQRRRFPISLAEYPR